MSVSCETFAKTNKEIFQNEHFIRDICKNRQGKLSKQAFRTRHSQKLTKKSSKMSLSYETFAKTDKEIFQNEPFVRDIRKNREGKLPKWAFRTRHSQKLTNSKRSSKMSVSYETFAKTNKEIFQNEHSSKMSVSYETFAKTNKFKEIFQNKHFIRDICKNRQGKLPKQAFRTRHSQKLTKKSSKMSLSYETFAKTDKEIFQNEPFVRDIRKN